jgi:phosphatidylglycerophosphatase A
LNSKALGQKKSYWQEAILWLATGGYSGYCPLAPGTAGSVVGVLIFLLFSSLSLPIFLLSTLAFLFLAVWVAERAEILLEKRDHPQIVIDEVAGFLITMGLLPKTVPVIVTAFLFFRIFDIIKPFPAGFIDRRLSGGLAVVLDDVVAGVYSHLCLQGLYHGYPEFFSFLAHWL